MLATQIRKTQQGNEQLKTLLKDYYTEIVLGRQLSDDATYQDIHAWDERVDALQRRAEVLLPELTLGVLGGVIDWDEDDDDGSGSGTDPGDIGNVGPWYQDEP